MTTLEERLRSELRAESELIAPGSLVKLRLPATPARRGWMPRSGGPRRPSASAWIKPLAAAAAVVAVVAGTLALVNLAPGTPPSWGPYPGAPRYYAVGVPKTWVYRPAPGEMRASFGVKAHQMQVRSTVTGDVVTTVSPPDGYNEFSQYTANASGTTFVFAVRKSTLQKVSTTFPSPNTGGGRAYVIDLQASVKFLMLSVLPGGATRLTTVPLTVPVAESYRLTMSLSPDGGRLAVAYGGGTFHGGGDREAVVRVITLATGAKRQWTEPPALWYPQLDGVGSWTANSRTLAVQIVNPDGQSSYTQVDLLDTASPASSLAAASKQLMLERPTGRSPTLGAFITPDGSEVILSFHWEPPHRVGAGQGELVVYPTIWPGRVTPPKTIAGRWAWKGPGGDPYSVVLSSNSSGSQLVVLQPDVRAETIGILNGNTFTPSGKGLPSLQSPAYQQLLRALLRANAQFGPMQAWTW